VMNTRRAPFDDWRVREALITAFNFDAINETITGGRQPRITSYFSGSDLAMRPGPAEGRVRDLLQPYRAALLPGALEGYSLPEGDGGSIDAKERAALGRDDDFVADFKRIACVGLGVRRRRARKNQWQYRGAREKRPPFRRRTRTVARFIQHKSHVHLLP